MLRLILRISLAVVLVIVLIGAGALGYRAWRQYDNSRFLAIETPNGINEAGFVEIGGVRQWVQIRGEDRNNPVILLVHGGPGMATIPVLYRSLRAWERDYTIVQWDQRGAGRTLIETPDAPRTPIARYVEDGAEVARYALAQTGKDKLILLGWSWGSLVGTLLAEAHPDLFSAYVGTGQVVNLQRNEEVGYRRLLERVRAEEDRDAEAKLAAIGPPPYADVNELVAERQILLSHAPPLERGALTTTILNVLFAPGYSLRDVQIIASASTQPDPALIAEMMAYDAKPATFALPMFYILGADDIQTPTELVAPYVDSITAPHKEIVVIPYVGHFAIQVSASRFLAELNDRVRPYAVAAHPTDPAAASQP